MSPVARTKTRWTPKAAFSVAKLPTEDHMLKRAALALTIILLPFAMVGALVAYAK